MLLVFLSLLFLLPWPTYTGSVLGPREFKFLSNASIASLASTPDPVKNLDPANPQSHLSRILIPRAAQTENNTLVRKYLISTLQNLRWHIEEDEFTMATPIGPKKFVNVIATKDVHASRRVILAAHFDSKWFPDFPKNQFVGATDSAAPCAMMLDLAEALNPLLDERAEREEDDDEDEDILDTTLQLVFFDGEEAFISWTDKDSIYGARHLAEKWESTFLSPSSLRKRRLLSPQTTLLSTIEHFILLDLLGAKNPHIRNYFTDTAWLFDRIKDTETRLAEAGHLNFDGETINLKASPYHSFFTPRNGLMQNIHSVEDDHIPFFRRGVSVLHLIPEPFPRVWHELSDDASALDIPTMRRWNILLRLFLAEYLNLRPPEKAARSAEEETSSQVEESGRVKKSDSEL